MRRTSTFHALCMSSLLFALAMPAAAQLAPRLPASVVESASVGNAERAAIDEYLGALAQDALSGDDERGNEARALLVRPLRENRPSVSFRQAYARSAADLIVDLIGSENTAARLAGLRLAGNLATGDTARVVSDALSDPDAGVRVFAAVQARRVFEVSSDNGPALTDSQSSELVDALADAMADSDSRAMTEALIRALGAAAQSRPPEMSSARAAAATRLAESMSGLVSSVEAIDLMGMRDPIIIAASSLTRTLSDSGNRLSSETAKAAAGFGGDVLARLLTREIEGLNDADASGDIRLLRAAESLVYFARQRQAGSGIAVPQTNLAGLLESGSRDFRRELVALIGPGSGMLDQFGFADDRFVE